MISAPKIKSVPKLVLPIERFELKCGGVLLVSHRPSAPVCAVYAHIRGGPAFDAPGLEGSAYLVGGLADQGTRRHGEEAIANLLEPAGGALSGDAGGLAGTIVNSEWPLLLELMSDQLMEPTYPRLQVERQKRRLLDRLSVEKDDPRTQGGLKFRRLVYGDHWLGRAAYGTIESVRKIGPAELRAHHRRNWVGKRAVIAVCGDVDPKQVLKTVDKLLARWNPGAPLATTPPKFPARGPRVDVFAAERQQVHLHLGHLGITRSDPDYPALVVMDHVLGTGPGFTNRIARKLRDEMGLAYSVSANIHGSAGILPGLFSAYIGTSPIHVAKALKGFIDEIRLIQNELVGADELDIAKSYLIGSFPLGFERASRRASYMTSAEVHRFPPDNLERLLSQFAAVTREDVQRVARKHLHPESSCVAASGPLKRKQLAAALAQAAAIPVRGR
ncbi:MAG: insulinase family protein [Planctomycetes bacterium]|nr:insulinase family protein [Planctomycetota bacterium]